MFDIGFWELAVIGVVALLVVGPERMPGLIRTAGQWAGQVQRLARDLRREIEREAQTDEFRKLNQEFLDEDRRLKESVRAAAPPPTALADAGPGDEPGEEPGDEPRTDGGHPPGEPAEHAVTDTIKPGNSTTATQEQAERPV